MSREVSFAASEGTLEMSVTPRRGRPYTHRCALEIYGRVAHDIERRAGGATIEDVCERLDLPHTQVAVALAFMKERGCVEVRPRRSFPASKVFFEDAMLEVHALEHGSEGSG